MTPDFKLNKLQNANKCKCIRLGNRNRFGMGGVIIGENAGSCAASKLLK